jgi:hypothetical protein
MKKQSLSKLQLSRETLRALTGPDLTQAVGLTCSACRTNETNCSNTDPCSHPCTQVGTQG